MEKQEIQRTIGIVVTGVRQSIATSSGGDLGLHTTFSVMLPDGKTKLCVGAERLAEIIEQAVFDEGQPQYEQERGHDVYSLVAKALDKLGQ